MLNKCKSAGCNPVEQTREKMGLGDYPNADENYFKRVELDDSNRHDIRICCKVCGTASGWGKADAPGMPGAGRDYMIKCWNETHKAV